MKKVAVSKDVSSYRLSTECDPSDIVQTVKEMEDMAEKVRKIVDSGNTDNAAEAVPSIAGAGTTSDGVVMLFETDWGERPRTMRDVLQALKANGIFLPTTTLSSILFNLIKRGRLKRWKSEGTYVYNRS